MLEYYTEIRVTDVVDVVVVAVLLWAAIAWLRRTRARHALLGLAVLGAVNVVARRFELQLTTWILQGFFAVVVLILIVVFQEDLRRFFEQIGSWRLRRRKEEPSSHAVDLVVRSVKQLANTRTGALIVFPGTEPLERHLEGGILLDAHVSEPLLLSLFDPHSPGHDGAVLMVGQRVARFAVHLPLSHDHSQLNGVGTRHAAALGLSERADALAVVVSEERGTVSVARGGVLRRLSGPEALTQEFDDFLAVGLEPEEQTFGRRMRDRWVEVLAASGLSLALWFFLVSGASISEINRTVPVSIENLPEGYILEAVDPEEVEVTLSGRRRDLYLIGPEDLDIRIDALLAGLGRRTFEVRPGIVRHPPAVEVVGIDPGRIKLSLQSKPEVERKGP